MLDTQFKKETFKQSVEENVKKLYRKTIDKANEQEVYQAVCYAVKDVIMDNWLKTQNAMDEEDPKMVYYMSMEFLMGRALGNNLINLTAYNEVKEALDEMGFDLNVLEDQEEGPGSWKRRTWTTGCMFPGFSGDSRLSGLWLRNPLPLRYVQTGDRRSGMSDRSAGQLAERRISF